MTGTEVNKGRHDNKGPFMFYKEFIRSYSIVLGMLKEFKRVSTQSDLYSRKVILEKEKGE